MTEIPPLPPDARVLLTGGTGLVGSHVAERLRADGVAVRALCRTPAEAGFLADLGCEVTAGDLSDAASLTAVAKGVTHAVHCAAKVGDWGPVEEYRAVNVGGTRALLDALAAEWGPQPDPSARRLVHVSSLGVYETRDHHGTDESEPVSLKGIDGYTLTKAESELLVLDGPAGVPLVPATAVRPGFVYGVRDRTVLPKLLAKLKSGGFAFLGDGEQLLNNVAAANVADAVVAALTAPNAVGRAYNLTDGRLVTRREFVRVICEAADLPVPTRSVPLPVARGLAATLEGAFRLMGKKHAPLLSSARIKFLGLNLDFNIDRAKDDLNYSGEALFHEVMPDAVAWTQRHAAGERT
ncbi:NAD-dependent epimerase/dehydratase family protein [Alienimonas californiensis]|uniref:3 beta-hydroxysteroid dehydrogenase/Delta 5-->4-isomerase n=1 Tax=Alienimonas californiensis TaxID=2527989 RepID=A0A517PEF2_9PLAN|nr:NAD-dependent epimerase/dehydratase family protein [Alienimonas californiensis]QDT17752.1 3 beta-hydroxysteroid dehydrogenase/Delta 5-->4-isomerase [Alienimonas californiensis]